jgi:CheY-like chemotaxis protein
VKIVLVVEDDFAIRDLVSEVLDAAGYRVLTAENGVEALAKIDAQPPDLVVSDLMMPLLDGVELAARLRSDPRFQKLPMIAMSGAMHLVAAARTQFTTLLAKPFDFSDLVASVDRFIGDT